ncbi:MAG TPA: aldehyde dehydrogenase family protein, partial [Roseiarcus sp.]|nr:aldehyde dehydrogenase family protein [Roseiarcus sp.]
LRARMGNLRVGDPLDKAIDMGAIVAPVQLERIKSLVEAGRREGAQCWQAPVSLPGKGLFFPPTLFTEVEPASTIAQVEIFGPVLAAMTFRTPDEAVSLANNTPYGLASSVWSENINLCLEAAAKIKAGVVWINGTNMFDAAAGFGGYRESGFGREGGREGMLEYLREPFAVRPAIARAATGISAAPALSPAEENLSLDRTAKQFIGGKQARPDSGYSYSVLDPKGRSIGQAALGNRKDIRNAVEAAHKAGSWSSTAGHTRAQVLYFLAENLGARAEEFARRIAGMTGVSARKAKAEVAASITRIIHYAALADKYDGRVHHTKARHVTLAMPEPWGVMGLSCPDEAPLLALLSLVLPAIAMGNRVIVTPSPVHPLAAADLYQVLETSDLPAGVVNIVTGERDGLAKTLAEHDDIAAHWYFGSAEGSAAVEKASAGNLKATWVNFGRGVNWFSPTEGQGEMYLHHATQIKNIWVPYGE